MGGIGDWLFGGEKVTKNPYRAWAERGPTAMNNYYDQALADARVQYDQYWSVWNNQMATVDQMFHRSSEAYGRMYASGMADLDAQWKQASKEFDTQVEDIRKQEKEGQANLTRKAYGSGLVGTTAQRDWKAGLEDRANEAVNEVEDRRLQAEDQINRAKLDLKAQHAAGMADTHQLAGATRIDTLSKAPIGPAPWVDLGLEKMMAMYATPWESYAQDIVEKTPGMITDVMAPAFFSGLGSAGAMALTGGLAGLGGAPAAATTAASTASSPDFWGFGNMWKQGMQDIGEQLGHYFTGGDLGSQLRNYFR